MNAFLNSAYRPEITLGEIIAISITLLGVLIWGWRWWISKSPFEMEVFKEKYESIVKTYPSFQYKLIQGIHELFPTSLTLIIKPKINKNFEQINVRFIENKWILFNRWGQFFRYKHIRFRFVPGSATGMATNSSALYRDEEETVNLVVADKFNDPSKIHHQQGGFG